MALSRFWVALFLCSIAYLLIQLFTGRYYSIEFAVSGKKDDPLLQREYYLDKLPPEVERSLQSALHFRWQFIQVIFALQQRIVLLAAYCKFDGIVSASEELDEEISNRTKKESDPKSA